MAYPGPEMPTWLDLMQLVWAISVTVLIFAFASAIRRLERAVYRDMEERE